MQRQSQVDFVNPNITKFPFFADIEAFEVVLEPGDLLYLPPFWFHRVTAETTSISVNVWSDSTEGDLRLALEHLPIPFEDEWSDDQIVVALQRYLSAFLQELASNEYTFKLDDMIQRQFIPVFGKRTHVPQLQQSCKPHVIKDKQFSEKISKEKFKSYVTSLADCIRNEKNPAVQEQSVAAFLESITYFFVGAERVNDFFQTCLET